MIQTGSVQRHLMMCCSRNEGMNPIGGNVIAMRICNVIS